MKARIALVIMFGVLFGRGAIAQEEHKFEITGDYSYMRFNPGLPSLWNSQNLNGGGGDATFFFTPLIGLKADLQGYGSFTQCTKAASAISGCASANLFTYMFGPEVKFHAGRLQPFGEVLFGGAHSNFYGNACSSVSGLCGSRSPSNNAFSMAVGGGVDIAVSRKISIRLVDADFVLNRFGNNFTGGNNSQSNFRFQTGVQFWF
jgi:opacity protein-like surface antigen